MYVFYQRYLIHAYTSKAYMGGAESLKMGRSELFHRWIEAQGESWKGVFCREFSVNSCFRLPDHCSVFHAKLASFSVVCSHSDSRAAIQAQSLLTVSSKLVKECMVSLAVASSYFHSQLVCVAGHSAIVGNCIAVCIYIIAANNLCCNCFILFVIKLCWAFAFFR